MAHHKRRRPKSRRAGCLMCKPHKHQGYSQRTKVKHRVKKQFEACNDSIKEAGL